MTPEPPHESGLVPDDREHALSFDAYEAGYTRGHNAHQGMPRLDSWHAMRASWRAWCRTIAHDEHDLGITIPGRTTTAQGDHPATHPAPGTSTEYATPPPALPGRPPAATAAFPTAAIVAATRVTAQWTTPGDHAVPALGDAAREQLTRWWPSLAAALRALTAALPPTYPTGPIPPEQP